MCHSKGLIITSPTRCTCIDLQILNALCLLGLMVYFFSTTFRISKTCRLKYISIIHPRRKQFILFLPLVTYLEKKNSKHL